MTRESFSSEIGDVHERRGDRPSFTNEFRGASDSLIEDDRPPRILDAGRRGRRLMLGIIVVCAALVGGGWSLWYWSAPIGAWIAGLGRETEEASTTDDTPAEVAPTAEVEPLPPPPTDVPTPEAPPEQPVEPQTPAAPPPAASTKIQTTATQVRGKVSGGAVDNRLAVVDAALPSCWADAVKAGATAPVELELSLVIKWSGSANSISVSGGSDPLNKCVRGAVKGKGWPKPRDGGEAKVTRRWTLGG